MAVLPMMPAHKTFRCKQLYRWRHCLRQSDVSQASTKTVFIQVVSTAPSSQLSSQLSSQHYYSH
jgi:hypothetical protein